MMADETSSQHVNDESIGDIIWERDGSFWREPDQGDGVTRYRTDPDAATVDHLLSWITATGDEIGVDSIEPCEEGWSVAYWIDLNYAEETSAPTLREALIVAVRDLHERGVSADYPAGSDA